MRVTGKEATFTLYTSHQQLAFVGKVSKKRLKCIFKHDKEELIQIIMMLLGDYFLKTMHKYKTNVDVVTMVLAWGLELGERKDVLVEVLRLCVEDDWLGGLMELLQMTMSGVGFNVGEGLDINGIQELRELVPYMRWPFGLDRDERRAEAMIAWDSLKLFLKEKMVASRGDSAHGPRKSGTAKVAIRGKGKRKIRGKGWKRAQTKSGEPARVELGGCVGGSAEAGPSGNTLNVS